MTFRGWSSMAVRRATWRRTNAVSTRDGALSPREATVERVKGIEPSS